MKRSGPLQRRTPLMSKKPMKRGGLQGYGGPWPSKKTPIKVKRPKTFAAQHNPKRLADEAWTDVRLGIYARACGRCEVCGAGLNIANMEGHHRRSRSVKGRHRHCPCNALALCSGCHAGPEVHGSPERARENGRILAKLDDTTPSEIPALIHGRGLTILTCGGTYVDVTAT